MALIITIIVLLILAGITISLTVGQRGILNRAQEAGRNYEEAARRENEQLTNFLEEADNIIAGINAPEEPKYTMVDGIPVPKGFEHVEGTGTTENPGFVIRDNSGTETNGNEFVWIPCTEDGANGSIKYDRYAFSRNEWQYTQTKNEKTGEITGPVYEGYVFTEIMPSIEINSIKKYRGFYIGRYEVGVVEYDEDVKTSNSNNETEWTGYSNGTAVVQANKQVWNYITKDEAKKVAEGMYTNNNAVVSKLCSSYAWDTVLQFIETKNTGYATNSERDNYSGELKKTGEGSISRNNIYDIGGNVCEWTTEVFGNQDYPCTCRGGNYGCTASIFPASYRYAVSVNLANNTIGFRSILYVQ